MFSPSDRRANWQVSNSERMSLTAMAGASDEELIVLYRQGSERALELLLGRYRNFSRSKAYSYFLQGADREDIQQEAMIGLYKAIRDFNEEAERSFRVFAEVCVTRQIITAVKTATRQKHSPMNSYVSLSHTVGREDDGDASLGDVLPASPAYDPPTMVISNDEVQSMKLYFSKVLSSFEADVLHLYMEGKSYQEISARLGRAVKPIDNAIQRIKKKVEIHLSAREFAA